MTNTFIEYTYVKAADGRRWLSTSTHVFSGFKLVHKAYEELFNTEADERLEAFKGCELVTAKLGVSEWDVDEAHFTMDTYRLELEG